jgi:hypothetical protein
MHLTETSQVEDGVVYFYMTWRCCDYTWEMRSRWDDIEALTDCPICPRCYANGSLFLS